MSNLLQSLLAAKDTLIADGAMGTNLFAAGLQTGDAPDLWNLEFPDRVAALHTSMVEAGADIILSNTFGANRRRLALHDAREQVAELNRAGVAIARQVADAAPRDIVVAGSMGPTGDIFQPVGEMSHEEGVSTFAEQTRALAEAGADVLWIETLSGREELAAAVEGAATAGLAVVATMTFDTNGHTMMGLSPAEAVARAAELAATPVAFGSNCGIGPAALVDSILGLAAAAAPGEVIVAKGNCGIPEFHDGHIHYTGTPAVMADYARMARDAGARIIGGCCGTTPEHLRAMVDALRDYQPGPPPTRADIEARLGPLAAGADAVAAELSAERRRGRRRRRG